MRRQINKVADPSKPSGYDGVGYVVTFVMKQVFEGGQWPAGKQSGPVWRYDEQGSRE